MSDIIEKAKSHYNVTVKFPDGGQDVIEISDAQDCATQLGIVAPVEGFQDMVSVLENNGLKVLGVSLIDENGVPSLIYDSHVHYNADFKQPNDSFQTKHQGTKIVIGSIVLALTVLIGLDYMSFKSFLYSTDNLHIFSKNNPIPLASSTPVVEASQIKNTSSILFSQDAVIKVEDLPPPNKDKSTPSSGFSDEQIHQLFVPPQKLKNIFP